MADSTGTVVHWNAEAVRLFGHAPEEVLGRTLDVIVPEEYRAAHWAAFRRVMAGESGKLDGASAHIPVRCRDGRVRTFPGRFAFLRDPDQRVFAALATYTDGDRDAAPFRPITPGDEQT